MEFPSVRDKVSPAEWDVRKDLAAAYNAAAHYRFNDHIYTHFSARVPGEDAFLINAYGLGFDEITASSLVKVNIDGQVLLDATGLGINPAGFIIHSTIHTHRDDAHCVMHTHSAAGVGVSTQAHGLLMVTQHAMRFFEDVGYHDYYGVVLDEDEGPALVEALGRNTALILKNHGLLVCGMDVPDAFDALYYLERACQAQIAALAGGSPLHQLSDDVARRVRAQFDRLGRPSREKHWPPVLRMVERTHPEVFT